MKAHVNFHYTSRSGVPMTSFTVTGTDAEIAAFKVAQGEYYRSTDDGKGHVFTCPGTHVLSEYELQISRKGRPYIIDPIKQQANVVAQYGGNLGQSMADQLARETLAAVRVKGMPQPQVPQEGPKDGQDLGQM